MLISVIIPAFNEEKLLEQTIERIELALNEHKDQVFTWEIIVCLKRYDRSKGKKFTVLHRHPVITSGRKGEKNFFSLVASNFAAIVLFILHYLLPKRLISKLGSKLLGYWYKSRW